MQLNLKIKNLCASNLSLFSEAFQITKLYLNQSFEGYNFLFYRFLDIFSLLFLFFEFNFTFIRLWQHNYFRLKLVESAAVAAPTTNIIYPFFITSTYVYMYIHIYLHIIVGVWRNALQHCSTKSAIVFKLLSLKLILNP